MEQVTNLGKLNKPQLRNELVDIVSTLQSRLREYGGIVADYNSSYYPAYAQCPSNSVSAKERAAEYECLDQLNDKVQLEAELRALTAVRDLIVTILPYAPE